MMSCGMVRYNQVHQMHIELTSKCNASCPGCPRNVDGGFSLPWLDRDEWKINDFKKSFPEELLKRQRFILFCGNYGDPGVCKDLIEIVDYIKSCNWGNTLRIHTNGGMRTPDFWSKLATVMNPDVDQVIFSIDGLQDTNHIYRRGVVWDKLMENVKAYINSGGSATWEYLIFGHNQHQIDEAKQMASDLKFNDFFYKKAFGFTEEHYGQGLESMRVLDRTGEFEYLIPAPSEEHLNQMSLQQINTMGKAETKMHGVSVTGFTETFKNNRSAAVVQIKKGHMSWLDYKKDIDCMSIRNKEIYIDASGGVHPCCFLGHVSQDADGIVNMQYRQWIEDNIGLENINCKTSSIEHILDNTDYFERIKSTWEIDTHANGRIAQCTKMCAKEHNPVTSLYEDLHNRNQKTN